MKKSNVLQKVIGVLALVMAVSALAVMTPQRIEAADKSFKSTGSSSVTVDSAQGEYIKFKAGKTGYITLTIKDASTGKDSSWGYLALFDGKKKQIGQTEAFDTDYNSKKAYMYTRSYGVKKGVTYYFVVRTSDKVKISAKVTAVSKSNGNSRGKAKVLKQGQAAKGVIIAGEKKADWYRINLTKSARLKLTLTAKTNGLSVDSKGYLFESAGIKYSFMDKNGKLWAAKATDFLSPCYDKVSPKVYYTVNNAGEYAIDAGTYYLKIEPYNAYSSGGYTVKWTTY